MRKNQLCIALALAGLIVMQPARAEGSEQMEVLKQTTLSLINALVQKGILTQADADAMVKQAEEDGKKQALANDMAPAQPGDASGQAREDGNVVRVPYIPEFVKKEIKEQLRQEVVAQAKTEGWGDPNVVPEWVGRMKWSGDIRVREQSDLYAKDNALPVYFQAAGNTSITNTTVDQNRARLRLRLALDTRITDQVSAGIRIATGDTTNPVSTNQTLGSNTGNKFSLLVDRAFIKAQPLDSLSVSGGLMPNPFFSTSLLWDDNLNFEGVAATVKAWPHGDQLAKPFLTLGAFPLQNVQSSDTNLAKNKWLYAAQAGLDWKVSPFSQWRFGLAYYDYSNIKGTPDSTSNPNAYDATASGYRQKGNSLYDISATGTGTWGLASDYKLINLTAMADFSQFDPIHVILSGDVVKNVGYNASDVASKAIDPLTLTTNPDYAKRTLGWQTQVTVGKPAMALPGDWQAFFGYRYVQRDAVLDAFTDSDFNLGGTNAKGYFLGGSYGLDRNTWLTARWLSANSIDGLPFGVDTLQVDLNAKF